MHLFHGGRGFATVPDLPSSKTTSVPCYECAVAFCVISDKGLSRIALCCPHIRFHRVPLLHNLVWEMGRLD